MLAFMKARPTTYVIHYQRGHVKREGAGLAFVYYNPTSSIVAIPVGGRAVPSLIRNAFALRSASLRLGGTSTTSAVGEARNVGVQPHRAARRRQHLRMRRVQLGLRTSLPRAERPLAQARIQARRQVRRDRARGRLRAARVGRDDRRDVEPVQQAGRTVEVADDRLRVALAHDHAVEVVARRRVAHEPQRRGGCGWHARVQGRTAMPAAARWAFASRTRNVP